MEISLLVLFVIVIVLLNEWLGKKEKLRQAKEELEKTKIELQQTRADLTHHLREEWLAQIGDPGNSYKNEIEVEIKFVYMFLKLLGYRDSDLDIRVRVRIAVGTQEISGEADWLVWRENDREGRQPFMVIEAKARSKLLDESVVAQARSYAFALNAPIYVLTNGVEIRVYFRNIVNDRLVLGCKVEHLREHWDEIQTLIGAHREASGEQIART